MTDVPLHPAIEPLAAWLGTWRGAGQGVYPTIDGFSYREETRLWHSGRPVIAYSQQTTHPSSGATMHAESGFWRPRDDGIIELVIAHSFGIAEVSEGAFDPGRADVTSRHLAGAASASTVEAVRRIFAFEGDTLSYEVHMAAAGQDLQKHLSARLSRV